MKSFPSKLVKMAEENKVFPDTPDTPTFSRTRRPSQLFDSLQRIAWGADIGGTLSKIVYFHPDQPIPEEKEDAEKLQTFVLSSDTYGETGQRDQSFEMHSDKLGGTLHFIKFQTHRMPDFFSIIKRIGLRESLSMVSLTGGGAFKFEEPMRVELGVEPVKKDELECLVKGINFFMYHYGSEECFYFDISSPESDRSDPSVTSSLPHIPYSFTGEEMYPYLLVNVGSGVSILLVEGETEYRRVGGSGLGGATFLGLTSLLTDCQTFDESLNLARAGDGNQVHMLVSDIYGGNYDKFGLSANTTASFFGKMVRPDCRNTSRENIARATLEMITNNLGSVALLHASVHNVKHIVFGGNFLARNDISMRLLSVAVSFWSKGNIKALFLKHEGYFGAIGALLHVFEHSVHILFPEIIGTAKIESPIAEESESESEDSEND